MSISPCDRVIRRLRANRLIPAGSLIRLATAGPRLPDGRAAAWLAVHPVSGDSLGVGSLFSLRQVAASRQWILRKEDGITLVEPGDAQAARLTGPGKGRT